MSNIPLSINETQTLLINKSISAVELTDIYLNRVNLLNSDLNAFLTVSDEPAYKRAKEIDKLISEHGKDVLKTHPLLGVAVSYKDLFLTKGIRTTAASNVLADYVPAYSGTVVNRVDGAGAICLGKVNCDAWAHGASGENSDFGPSKNPWNKDFVPGGSCSGSAVAVSAGMSLVSFGTDTGGSIRQPANFCGVVGLKPTYGSVSRYGVIAMASSLDTIGHFTTCVSDSEFIYDITKGVDGKDATLKDLNFKKPDSKVKIGVPKEYFVEGIDNEVKERVLEAIKVYEKEGCEIVDISIPHTKYAIDIYYIVMPAEVSSNLGRYDGIRYGNDRSHFGDEAKRRIMLGTYVLSSGYYDAYYLKAMKVRSILTKEFDSVFEKVDAIIAPVYPTPAFRLGEKVNDPLKMYLADVFTVSANLVGIPGLSIPFGFSKSGLPLGFQLMGPRFSESLLFALGREFEKATNFSPAIPNI